MPKEFSRSLRIGDQIQRELADLLNREVKDPRIGMVTITAVKMATNLAYATIYVSMIGDHDIVNNSLTALKNAAGFLRSALATRLRAKTVPALHFVYDSSVERGIRIGALIDAAIAADQQLHQEPIECSENPK